ncbi:MAG: hypothetical protein J3Q66DRAFT_321093 [Benniella sp.]|nr:MAG: hypothetical protein J3Q66DRAFT_321093 [Benniella sp.]
MVPWSISHISFTLLVILLLGSTQLTLPVHAQAFKPLGLSRPTSSYIDRQRMFFAAGEPSYYSDSIPRTQAFAIDLSVSWNTSNPVFNKLPDSPPLFYGPSAMSADGKQWVVFDNTTAYTYNLDTAKWSTLFHTKDIIGGDHIAVTDPETGFIYSPATFPSLMRLNITSKSYDRLMMPKELKEADFYSAAWSTSQKKMYLIGGKTNRGFEDQLLYLNMLSYNDKDGWRNLTRETKGDIPQPRFSACLEPAFGGTKMVLFGGYTRDKVLTLPEIHILDVATMVWKRGPDIDQKERRAQAACAVSNDHFIAWGGIAKDTDPLESYLFVQNSTVVFNLKTNNWTSIYNATSIPSTTSTLVPSVSASTFPTGTPIADDSRSSGGLSLDATIAIIALGVAGVALAFGTFILCRMRRRRSQKGIQGPASNEDSPKPAITDNDVHVNTSKANDFSGRGPQESSLNGNSEFEKYVSKNPQRPVAQFPPQAINPANPHATIPPQPSQDPQWFVTKTPLQAFQPVELHGIIPRQPPQNPHSLMTQSQVDDYPQEGYTVPEKW